VVIDHFALIYPNVLERKDVILTEIDREEKQFLETLEK
jgi:alanyl-tRNA synthetase